MYRCILNQEGEILEHRHLKAAPEPFLQAMAPYREDLVVCGEGLFPGSWLADLCAHQGMPGVLGHALYMQALHGGKATNEKLDAQKIAVLRRGGMLPHADVYPAERRATRALLRRRRPLMHNRAALLAHIPKTNSQYNRPESGPKRADKANRRGVAARFPEPAVHKSIEVDLALMDPDAYLLRDVALGILTPATPPDGHTRYLLRTSPGLGEILRLVRLYESHDIQRFPRGQDCVSYCR